MDDTGFDESIQDKIILFIYSQEHYRKELVNLNDNDYIAETKCSEEFNIGGKTHYIFFLILKGDYEKEPIELEFERDGILYSSKIEIKDIYPEMFLFKIDFNPKENKKSQLSKFTMDYLEQFKLFLKLKNDKKLNIDFSDKYLKNLCLSAINFISSTEENTLTLDFLFNIFINSYLIQKKEKDSQEILIKNFFDSLKIKSISSKNTDIKVQSKDDSKYKEDFSNVQNIQKELVELGGEINIDKINIILAYYYLKNSPKNFVNLISLENNYSKNIFQNLKKNSKIFNDFSSEIIDFKLFNEAENMDQIEILLKLLPNMVELFKIFLDMDFFVKISNLSQIEGKCIDVLEIVLPKSTDDLDSLYNYFFVAIETCEYEGIVIFKLPDKFFLDYANFYAKKNLQNLKLIREMYEKYSSLTNINNTKETIKSLDNLYYEAGIQLIRNDKNFKNEEIINFFQESRKKEIETIGPDDVSKLIDLNAANEEFINNFLNNNFKKFDLKVFFGKQFDIFIQKIFENFKKPDDFSNIKNWKISPNVNEEVLKYCIRRISIVIYEDDKNKNKEKNSSKDDKNKDKEKNLSKDDKNNDKEKNSLKNDKNKDKEKNSSKASFTDLINFLCNLFTFASRKIRDFTEELKEVEKNISSNKLIEVYFRILHKGKQIYPISDIFKLHLTKYVEENCGDGPLSVWYRLVIEESNERLAYLYKNLKPEYSVKKEHFLDYPENIQETISLFTYLYFGKYFTYNYITELDYYKNSINAKKELVNITYRQAEKIFNKYKQYYKLFKLFIPIKQFNEKNYNSEYTEFYKKLKSYKNQYDSLSNLNNYWKKFYSESKNNEITSLQNLIDIINNSSLIEFESKKDVIKEYIDKYQKEKNNMEINKSKIFNGIYKNNKDNFKGQKEEELFNNSLEEFNKLKDLKDKHLKFFNENLRKIIGQSFDGNANENEILDEIKFLFNYFGFEEDDNIKARIKTEFEELVIKPVKKPNPEPDDQIDPNPKPIPKPNEIMTYIENKLNNFIFLYNKYKNVDIQDEYIDNLKQFFEEVFKSENMEKIINLEEDSFLFIIQKMLTICLISHNIKSQSINIDNKTYLFKEFYEIYEMYKNEYNNNHSNLFESLKKILVPFADKLQDEEFKDILNGSKNLFTLIKNDNIKKKFVICFINILDIEIKKSSVINNKNKLELTIDLIMNFLSDDFIPLIDILSNNIFSNLNSFENIKNKFNSNYLLKLEKYTQSEKFKEQMLYYFESKINYVIFELNEESIENILNQESILNFLKQIISSFKNLEKPGNNNNSNLFTLFCIAYIKVIFSKYIDLINDNNNSSIERINNIFSEKNKFIESFSYYILKLYFDFEGNCRDFISSSSRFIKIPNEIKDKIETINFGKKYYGFDYLFLPLKKENSKKYNEIIKAIINSLNSQKNLINDLGILSDINKSDIDVFYCIISNLFLSHFTDSNYFETDNYKILKEWFEDRLKQNKFQILNEYSKKIINIVINLNSEIFKYNKDLLYLLFALRLVLNSLSSNKNLFYFKLLVNPKEIISAYKSVFTYFFNNNKNLEKKESFKLLKFSLLSHLLFSYKLDNIDLDEIKKITNITIGKDQIFKILNEEFDSIIKIIRYKGIKVKYIIIYMNIVFDKIKYISEIGKDNSNDFIIKYFENIITSEFYLKEIKKYFNLLKEIGINEDDDEFIKILFEDYDFYNNNNENSLPYIKYLTTPNFCTIEDFEYQYISSKRNCPIIEYILNNKDNENGIEIVNIANCLPRINSFINTIYNKKILTISREEAEKEDISALDLGDEKIKIFNDDILKLKNICEIKEITTESKLLEAINIKDNEIYKLYNNIIQKYNQFVTKLPIFNNDKDFLLPLVVQDFSKEISLFNNPKEGLKELKKILSIYSKRNRIISEEKIDKLNIYNGDKIDYDFQLIENILEKKYFIDKNIFANNQHTFIFSNEVFSGERNNLLADIMEKYPQEQIKESENLFSNIDTDDKENNINIYHNLQFIIIFINSLPTYSGNEKISLKDISEMIPKKIDIETNQILYSEDIYINNILSIYEKFEEICFEYFKEMLVPPNLSNEKDENIKDYLNNLELIKADVISKAAKKYLMRYCLGNYDKKENILKNMEIEKMISKRDIWEKQIFNHSKFKEECEKLKKLNIENDYYLDKYFLYNIINSRNSEEVNVKPQTNDLDNPKNEAIIQENEDIQGNSDYNFDNNENNSEDDVPNGNNSEDNRQSGNPSDNESQNENSNEDDNHKDNNDKQTENRNRDSKKNDKGINQNENSSEDDRQNENSNEDDKQDDNNNDDFNYN